VDLDCSEKFEQYVKSNFKEQFKVCSEFIRHKTTLINPENLLAQGI
jgi:hypothetical protein